MTWTSDTLNLKNINSTDYWSIGTGVTLEWSPSLDDWASGVPEELSSFNIYVNGVFNKNISYNSSISPQTTNITGLNTYTNYTIKIEALDTYGRETSNGPSESFSTPDGGSPVWDATPTFSSSSATQTNINWQCSDDNGQTMSYWINSQRFKPGFSPTYVGQVYSGTGASGSSQSATITGLDSEYIYEFNVYCQDSAGNSRDLQIQLGIDR